jgi:hypothetical protein
MSQVIEVPGLTYSRKPNGGPKRIDNVPVKSSTDRDLTALLTIRMTCTSERNNQPFAFFALRLPMSLTRAQGDPRSKGL